MTCSTHIVECLRNNRIEPEAFASNEDNYPASNALDYSTSTAWAATKNTPQWWAVNFKRKVSIKGYEISTNTPGTSDYSLYNWTLSVSNDNINWKVVHGPLQSKLPERSYNLNSPVNAIYAKIDGNSLHSSYPYWLYIEYVKFFGSLNPINKRDAASCKTKKEVGLFVNIIIPVLYS